METVLEPPEVITVRHLSAGYDREQVLEDINLTVYEGDFVGLIGPNGGGKTTLLKVLLGLLPPTRGEVRILGQSVREGRRMIGYVPQLVEFDREFPISVWDVARMGRLGSRRLLRRYTAEDDAVVADALRQVELYDLRDRPIGELSGGQRQRAYIARALVAQPRILLLDEPTSSVDPQVSTGIYEVLRRINAARDDPADLTRHQCHLVVCQDGRVPESPSFLQSGPESDPGDVGAGLPVPRRSHRPRRAASRVAHARGPRGAQSLGGGRMMAPILEALQLSLCVTP